MSEAPSHAVPLHLLEEIVVLFGSALVVIGLSRRLRAPPVVGFLITGMLVGPSGLGLIAETHDVEVFAELGVVFLLFVIGLELSIDKLRRLGRLFALGGPLQAAAATAATALVALAFDRPPATAFYFGFVVALSSTAIVLKLLQERRELAAPHGQAALGILLFQDFLIVPLLLIVPVLAGTTAGDLSQVVLRFGGGLLMVALVFVLGRFLLPRLLDLIVHTRIRELMVLGALVACLGGALITERLGFSPALGAFLAGILIAESDYHHQVLAETTPFRDVFNSMFFISIGMLLDLGPALAELPLILGLSLLILVLKGGTAIGAVALLRFPLRTALIAGLALAQIGEFSFVLIRAGERHGLLDAADYQRAIAAAVVSMLGTPLLIALGPRLADRLATRHRAGVEPPAEARRDHVVIVGYGLNGRHLARVLRAARRTYCIVELDGRRVQEARRAGEPVIYGDATRADVLEAAGIRRARIAVFATNDPASLHRGVRLALALNPQLHVIARTASLADLDDLAASGAQEIVAEELETSIELVTRVLAHLHVPGNVIRAQARLLRQGAYEMLRAPRGSRTVSEGLLRALEQGTAETFMLAPEHLTVGQTIRQLDLRRQTGATIIALVRGEEHFPNPDVDQRLEAGDVLVLIGSHAQLEAAFRLLEHGPQEPEATVA